MQVIRIVLGTFRNILEKVDDREIERAAALQMVQFKTLKTLELMDSKKFDDTELQDDIEFLSDKLHSSVQDLSSFDEYVTEVEILSKNSKPSHHCTFTVSRNAHLWPLLTLLPIASFSVCGFPFHYLEIKFSSMPYALRRGRCYGLVKVYVLEASSSNRHRNYRCLRRICAASSRSTLVILGLLRV